MRRIEDMLRNEVIQLKKIIEVVKRRLKNVPNGKLRISKSRGRVEYYLKGDECSDTRKNGRYLKANEKKIARDIAQRDYDNQVLKKAIKRVKAIEGFLDIYENSSLKDLYIRTNPLRLDLIDVVEISDEEYIKQWQGVKYEGKGDMDDNQIFITERGERVRSKSEKIIADKLYMMGIPYRYEFPLVLKGNIILYPDFTILKMPSREVVYLEHFGRMDSIGYVNDAFFRIRTYERNEIYVGINLFFTHETSKNPLNTKVLDEMLRKLFYVE